jgi:chemotaxis protein CheZ
MVQRKRFRIEDIVGGAPAPEEQASNDAIPTHRQIMAELRAIRDQMATPNRIDVAHDEDTPQQVVEAQRLLQTYRAQIEQCEKLKVELDLIYDAINRTKQEIAVLHGKSFSGAEMAKVTGELGAVVGGTEEATQQILEAAEAIDQSASALAGGTSTDQLHRVSEDSQDLVVAIFEACCFQDLSGQRIS